MNDGYKKQVALLIKIILSVYKIKDFAVHGGTAINLGSPVKSCVMRKFLLA